MSMSSSCGMAAGSGHFPEGTIVEIAAIPFSGNRFLQWDDGNSDNPRIVTLDGNSQFTALFDTEGINDVETSRWWLKSERGALIVEGAAGRTIKVYNMWGQLLHTYSQALNKVRFEIPAAGTYVVSVDDGPAKKIVGIELADKAIPRHGYTVLNMEGEPIGEVTTGYHTISTDKSVCMALIDTPYAKLDTDVQIQIRKKVFPGKVVKKQFYNKNYKK